jgi:4-aminobutyrate aminotransferase/(S)-3-amino-2-methylpropionate transaminase
MTETMTGALELQQCRRIVTQIPGPRSLELAARRRAALPAGLASSAGIYAAAAGGGVVVDVDGNSFIDLGSGIAVTTVGNAAPAVVSRATDQLARYTHTCFLATPYEPYLEVAETLNGWPQAHTRSAPRCSTPAVKLWRTRSNTPAPPPGDPRSWCSITRFTAARCSPCR